MSRQAYQSHRCFRIGCCGVLDYVYGFWWACRDCRMWYRYQPSRGSSYK